MRESVCVRGVVVTIAFMRERWCFYIGVCEQRTLLAGHQTYGLFLKMALNTSLSLVFSTTIQYKKISLSELLIFIRLWTFSTLSTNPDMLKKINMTFRWLDFSLKKWLSAQVCPSMKCGGQLSADNRCPCMLQDPNFQYSFFKRPFVLLNWFVPVS